MEKISRIITLMTALMLCSFFFYGQQLKTFVNKNYYGPNDETGTLTYTYYEGSNGDYVKHGKFSINTTLEIPKTWSSQYKTYVWGTSKYSVSANYKEGWLNGALTITATNNSMCTNKSYSGVFSSTLTANFNNGVPHGIWKMTRTKNGTKTFSISANFSNGMLVGSFNLNDELVGQLDNNGFFTGKWKKKENSTTEREYNFINHVYVSMYERQDGKVVWSRPETDFEKDLYKKFAEGQISTNELMKYGYSVDTSTSDLVGTKYMWDILYRGDDGFALGKIDGDKTNEKNRPERVTMGKYISLKKVKDVKFFKDENEFAKFVSITERYLKNEIFEDTRPIKSAKELWEGYYVNQEQENVLTTIYNEYVNDVLPQKLQLIEEKKRQAEEEQQRIEEEKRKAEEARLKEQQRIEEEKRKEIEKAFQKYAEVALDKMVELSSSKADIKIFGADIIIGVDYDNNSRFWNTLFSSRSSLRDKLGNQLKDFFPVASYKIDSVDLKNRTVYCTIEKYNKKDGSQYWQTQVVLESDKIELDQSFIFKKAKRVRGAWDEIRDLQSSIASTKTKIEELAGKDLPDIIKTYNDYHKSCNFKVTDDLNETIASLTKITNVQQSYITFIGLRKQVLDKQNQIKAKCDKECSDVAKSFESFLKEYNVTMSSDSIESYKRIQNLMTFQDSCLSFLNLRNIISANNNLLLSNKTSKNILKVYSTYIKSADLSWTPDLNCNDKLRKVINIQDQFLTAVKSPNSSELDAKIKKLKDKSLESVMKELK